MGHFYSLLFVFIFVLVCDICGDNTAQFVCEICDNKQLCSTCDTKWHKHPKRQNHKRKNLLEKTPEPEVQVPQTTSSGSSKEIPDLEDKYVTARMDLLPSHIAGMGIDDTEDRNKGQVGQTYSGQTELPARQVASSMSLSQQQQQQGIYQR